MNSFFQCSQRTTSVSLFAKSIVIFILTFICVVSLTHYCKKSILFFIIFRAIYLRFLDISFSQVDSVRCSNINIVEIYSKISEQISRLGFFLSQSLIGGDSGFSSKIRRIPTRFGWLADSLLFSQLCICNPRAIIMMDCWLSTMGMNRASDIRGHQFNTKIRQKDVLLTVKVCALFGLSRVKALPL